MACIEDRPNCGTADADIVPEALTEVVKWIAIIWGGLGAAISLANFLGTITVSGGIVSVGGTTIATGLFAGAGVGFVVAVTTFVVVLLSARDRCTQSDAKSECVAGVVVAIEDSFSSRLDELAPWRAMHDRVDLVVKSFFWQVVESGNAFVFCTDEDEQFRRSEIIRCYFFDRRVCDAAKGAVIGAGVGAVAGIGVAAGIALLLCVTVVLCILGLALAALAAAALVLGGAAVGGQLGKDASTDQDPTAEGQTLATGHLVTVNGPMERRGFDLGANVIYWADSAQFHGPSMSRRPFSYCEINDEFDDGCPRVPPPID